MGHAQECRMRSTGDGCDCWFDSIAGIPSSGTRYHFQRRANDGGPAFPCESPNEIFSGMTLRDYFAAKAMQAFISNGTTTPEAEPSGRLVSPAQGLAMLAYDYADAMLAERSK